MYPSWVDQAHARQEAMFRRMNAQRPSYVYNKRQGWTYKGMEIAAYPPPGHDWAPEVVRAIQEFAPDIQPIWVNYIYVEPPEDGGKLTIFGRHGLGRLNTNPHADPAPFPIRMPHHMSYNYWGFKMRRPNQIEWIFKGEKDPRAADIPGAYIPFGWHVNKFVRDNYREYSYEDLKRVYVDEAEEAYEKASEAKEAEAAYREQHYRKYAQKKLDQISEVELKEHLLYGDDNPVPTGKPSVLVSSPTESGLPAKGA